MFKTYKLATLLMITLLSVSCGSHKKAHRTLPSTPQVEESIIEPDEGEITVKENVAVETSTFPKEKPIKPKVSTYAQAKENYILTYKGIAMQEMRDYHIPASITLAQGLLESGAGKSKLSLKSNNHFGIKCHAGWKGERVYHDDDAKGECFRKYKDPRYSFRDHSLFLSQRKRYAGLFKLAKNDYKAWANGLRKAGYATDKKYPQKLIKLIEAHDLYKYDTIVLGKVYQVPVKKDFILQETHIVIKGDTLYSISKKYDIAVAKLKQLNALKDSNINIGQKLFVK